MGVRISVANETSNDYIPYTPILVTSISIPKMKWSQAIEEVIPQLDQVGDISKPAVVFDIDGTLLSLGGRRIEDTYNLYLLCREKGWTIFIITSRPDIHAIKSLTTLQLQNCGIQYKQLFLKPALILDDGFYKSEIRRSIQEKGYTIVLNVGDSAHDHFGGYSMINCMGK